MGDSPPDGADLMLRLKSHLIADDALQQFNLNNEQHLLMMLTSSQPGINLNDKLLRFSTMCLENFLCLTRVYISFIF